MKPKDWKTLDAMYRSKYDRQEIMSSFKNYCKFMIGFLKEVPIYPFHEVIMDIVQEAIDNKLPPRIALFMPMRHYKTLICADMFLTYMFGRKPHQRGVYGTGTENLAEERKREFERYVNTPHYQWLFPTTRIKSGLDAEEFASIRSKKGIQNTLTEVSNALSPRGAVLFAGEGSFLTGRPLNYGCCDDLYKDRAEAESVKVNARKKAWFLNVWSARFEKGSIGFLCYTRWTDDDVAGNQIRFDKENTDPDHIPYTILRFPGIKDKLDDNPYDTRKEGEALMESMRFSYAAQKQDPASYAALVQQLPVGLSDRYIYKDVQPPEYDKLPDKLDYLVISVDCTYHAKTTNVDTVGMTVMGVLGMKIYLLPDMVNEKLNFNVVEEKALQYISKYPQYQTLLIEAAANGHALADRLTLVAPKVVLVSPAGKSKRLRAQVVHSYFASNMVQFPSRQVYPRIQEVYDEMKRFTGILTEEKDDLLDTIHQTLKHYDDLGIFTKVMKIDTLSTKDFRDRSSQRQFRQFRRSRPPQRGYANDTRGIRQF